MHRDTLDELLRRQPFEPFAVHMSNGDVHQVRHPEFAFVLKTNFVIGQPDSDRVTICSVLHIASVETLQSA